MSDKKTKAASTPAKASKAAGPKDTKGGSAARGSVPPKAPGGPKSGRNQPVVPKAAPSQRGKANDPAAPAPARLEPSAERKEHGGFRRKIIGLVVGDKMNKTVTVEVIRKTMHPVYKKYVRDRDRYKAHDENNVYKVGDRVEIMEHRPISRHKRWLVTRLVAPRPVEA